MTATPLERAWTARRLGPERWALRVDDVDRELTVPPGTDPEPVRLERAVGEALGRASRAAGAPPRWEVICDEHHGGGLFELEITVRWFVVERASGERRFRFEGESSASYDGVGWSGGGSSGVDEVRLGADGEHLLVRSGDEVVSWALPPEGG